MVSCISATRASDADPPAVAVCSCCSKRALSSCVMQQRAMGEVGRGNEAASASLEHPSEALHAE